MLFADPLASGLSLNTEVLSTAMSSPPEDLTVYEKYGGQVPSEFSAGAALVPKFN
jgi:hypothetical protein